ncbi:hypothetical protein V8F20_012533 [Naviculisporaceae sp. PSN 640]
MELQRLDEPAPRPSAPKTNLKSWIPQVPRVWNLRQLIGLSAPKHEPIPPSPRSIFMPGTSQSETEHAQVRTPPITNSAPTLQSTASRESVECDADATSEHTITGGGTVSRSRTSTSHNSLASATSTEDNICSTTTSSQSTTLSSPSSSQSIDISQVAQIIQIDKGVFASPKLKMDECHVQAWNIIRSRLDDTLRHTFKPIPGLDATMSLEFMMAGPSPVQLKPSIVMVCCNEPHRRQLKKLLKTQKWISAYNYHCIVLVDPLQQLMDGSSDFSDRDETVWLVDAAVPTGSVSLCGAKARGRAVVRGEQKMVSFTIGGVIAIRDRNYAITAGHAFRPIDMKSQARHLVPDIAVGDYQGSDDEQDEDPESESPFVIFDDDDDADTRGSPTSTHLSPEEFSIHAHQGYIPFAHAPSSQVTADCPMLDERRFQEHETWIHVGIIAMYSAKHHGRKRDWALIDLEEPHRWSTNATLPVPSRGINSSLAVKSFAQETSFQAMSVWIQGGASGGTRAWSNNSPVQLYDLNAEMMETLEAQQFITDNPLTPGDSGAWAIQDDGTLCGHIVARRTGAVTLAYVVPISPVIEDIKALWQVSDVTLPNLDQTPVLPDNVVPHTKTSVPPARLRNIQTPVSYHLLVRGPRDPVTPASHSRSSKGSSVKPRASGKISYDNTEILTVTRLDDDAETKAEQEMEALRQIRLARRLSSRTFTREERRRSRGLDQNLDDPRRDARSRIDEVRASHLIQNLRQEARPHQGKVAVFQTRCTSPMVDEYQATTAQTWRTVLEDLPNLVRDHSMAANVDSTAAAQSRSHQSLSGDAEYLGGFETLERSDLGEESSPWKPYSMRAPYLMMLLAMPLILLGMAIQRYVSLQGVDRETSELPDNDLLPPAERIYRLSLVLCSALFGRLWHKLDLDIARLEPYQEMASTKLGAKADLSLHLDYPSRNTFSRFYAALGNRHYLVAFSSIGNLVFAYVVPILSMAAVGYSPHVSEVSGTFHQATALALFILLLESVPFIAVTIHWVLKRDYGLTGDVTAISDLAAMANHRHVLRDFKELDNATNRELTSHIRGRYKLIRGLIYRWDDDGSFAPKHDNPPDGFLNTPEHCHPYLLRAGGLLMLFVYIIGLSALVAIDTFVPVTFFGLLHGCIITVSFLTYMIWTRLDHAARVMEPYFVLAGRHAQPETLNLEYSGISTLTAIPRALRNRHFILASVLIGTIFSFVLPFMVFYSHTQIRTEELPNGSRPALRGLTWATCAILTYLLGVVVALFLTRRRPILPRQPNTIASILGFLYQSKMLHDFYGTSWMTRAQRRSFVVKIGKRYGFGWFQGRDGQSHCGVEEEELLSGYKLGYDYSMLNRPWHGSYRPLGEVDW